MRAVAIPSYRLSSNVATGGYKENYQQRHEAKPRHECFLILESPVLHRFRQTGFRFSMKALMPSLASSDFINSWRYMFSTSLRAVSIERAFVLSRARRVISRATADRPRSFDSISLNFFSIFAL